jgi:integrase/recombinase XerD
MKASKKSICLTKAIEGFILSRRAEGISPNTILIYRWTFQRLLEYLGDQDIHAIHNEDIQRFYLWLQTDYKPTRKNGDESALKPSSVEKAWSTLRSFYEWANETLGIERADSTIKRPKYRSKEITPFTEQQVKALLKACICTRQASTSNRKAFTMHRDTANRDTAIILVLLDTGLRVSECARLKVENLNTSTGEIFVDAFGTGQKTKSRHVYLGKQALKAIWRYLSDRSEVEADLPLFISRTGVSMDKNSIRLMVNELGKRAEVQGVHPHRFRHTFAIQYLRNRGDVFTLQRLLGHSTLDMVQHYLSIASADIQDAHRKASPADNWKL